MDLREGKAEVVCSTQGYNFSIVGKGDTQLIVGGEDDHIRLFDLRKGEEVSNYEYLDGIYSVKYCEKKRMISFLDRCYCVINLEGGRDGELKEK